MFGIIHSFLFFELFIRKDKIMTNRRFTKEEEDFLIENGDYYGVNVCADKLNRPVRSVSGKMRRLIGHATWKCSATQEEIDNLLFDEKWRPLTFDFSLTKTPKELAYFLGYFWADGYIDQKGGLTIEIIKEDADDIVEIFDRLATFQKYSRKREGRKEQSTLRYQNEKENVDLLYFLGKYPKSIESHEKIINYIPNKYIEYFLRGFFDGDGCLYITKTKYLAAQMVISGRYETDWSFLINFLKERYGITFRIKRVDNGARKYSQILCTDSKEIQGFLNKIYNVKDNIWLNRKYEKVKIILNQVFCPKENANKKDDVIREYLILTFKRQEPILIKKPFPEITSYSFLDGTLIPKYKIGSMIVDITGKVSTIDGIDIDNDFETIFYLLNGSKNKINENEIVGEFIKRLKEIEILDLIK